MVKEGVEGLDVRGKVICDTYSRGLVRRYSDCAAGRLIPGVAQHIIQNSRELYIIQHMNV
jgi:hypothetical protein